MIALMQQREGRERDEWRLDSRGGSDCFPSVRQVPDRSTRLFRDEAEEFR